jgi:multiple antibiotic resistance protein
VTLPWVAVIGFLVTLVGVYSPLAAAASYGPIIGHFARTTRQQIAWRLALIVSGFVVAAVWVGEAAIELLGVSTHTLAAVGGLALLYAGIPMMRGIEHVPPEDPTDSHEGYVSASGSWQEVLITPVAFPLSVGGTTIAISVASASVATNTVDLVVLSLVGVLFGVIVGITNYVGGSIPTRMGLTGRTVLNRAAGVLLTAIGLSLLVTNVTRMVVETGLRLGS